PAVRPWRAIWWRPRAALRAAAAAPAPLSTALWAALAGVSGLFAWAAWRGLGAEARPGEVLVIVLLAGVPLGLAALIIGGVLLRTSGQWRGGHAGARQVRAVLALAFAPVAGGLPLWLLQLALLPAASFGGLPLATQGPLLWLCWGAHGLLWLWAAGLSVGGLAAAHGISPWRAAASWLLAGLIVAGGLGVLFGGSALVIGLRGG
ncbi:MAG: YIP1 family protein, partial [Chloroflexi bacterium]|nr:YIP1 family protein [Chloroflexota bacterium]